MHSILCFGDSNTWGYVPGSGARHPRDVRWPGQLQKELGENFRIVEEGLCGRTTAFDDPQGDGLNGLASLPNILKVHGRIDLLIIMLGTNDMKARFGLSARTIAEDASALLKVASGFEPSISRVLLVAPPHIVATKDSLEACGFEGSIEKSKELAGEFQRFANECGCHFFDASSVARSSEIDGIHLDSGAHRLLAQGLHVQVLEIFRSS